ncbi:hypothetical protein CLU88_2210 [Acidovorax sp. 56]|nr:hypothetical protein [Acidovorax sp. 56]PIF27322.1 hypothetical protein CLU88_2210 [Acidovorax sp. 56]
MRSGLMFNALWGASGIETAGLAPIHAIDSMASLDHPNRSQGSAS